jgi:hypothetical protein
MVKLIKLVSGEEIMADIIQEVGTTFTVENPIRLTLSQKGVGMVPLSPFMKDSKLTLERVNVIYTAEADEELVNAYKGQFGGIVMAPPGLTLG